MKPSGTKYHKVPGNKFVSFLMLIMMFVIDIPFVLAQSADNSKLPAAAKQPVMPGESVFGVVFSLLLVVAVIFMLAWVMRRMGGVTPRSNAMMKIVGALSMGARERVVLIQVGEEQVLLGVAPGRIQTLHVLDKPLQMSDSVDMSSASFSDRLKSVINKGK